MLYREIIAVCSEIHTKHTNTLCGQNVELLNVKHGDNWFSYLFKIHFNIIFLLHTLALTLILIRGRGEMVVTYFEIIS
jgi:hypothetical protein